MGRKTDKEAEKSKENDDDEGRNRRSGKMKEKTRERTTGRLRDKQGVKAEAVTVTKGEKNMARPDSTNWQGARI